MKARLKEILTDWNAGRVLTVGDLVIDEMVYGHTHRLSREAPVLILKHRNTDIILGAAGNAAHNVASMQAKRAAIAGVAGKDYYCSLLMEALERDGIDACGLIQDETRPTSTKTRISGIANHSVTQQVVRIDRESAAPVSQAIETKLLETLSELAPQHDALLLSDYGLGVFTPAVREHCRALAQQHGLIMAVDSQQDLGDFRNATFLTPNQPEAEKNVGYSLDTDDAVLCAGRDLLAKTGGENVLITLGGRGMALFEKSGAITKIPAFNRSEVFDVTGAGDTVIGTMTLALTAGATIVEAAVLGNIAASIVVKRFGAATTTPAEILDTLESLDGALIEDLTGNIEIV